MRRRVKAVMHPDAPHKLLRDIDRLTFSALIGVAVVGLLQLLQLEKLDIPLTVSLFCFAVGIPLLGVSIAIISLEAGYGDIHYVTPIYVDVLEVLGTLAVFIGFTTVFWHFEWLAGLVFLGLSLAGCFTFIVIYSKLVRLAAQQTQQTRADEAEQVHRNSV